MFNLGKLLDALYLTQNCCLYCLKEFKPREQGYLCEDCLKEVKKDFFSSIRIPFVEEATAFGRYGGVLREVILCIKFKGVLPLCKFLGGRIKDDLNSFVEKVKPDLITYVPVSLFRFWGRGFSHNREILKHTGLNFEGVLRRVKHSKPLAGKGLEERIEAVINSYELVKSVEGKRVLVFDDITTTGSTASEIARVLIRGGAREVFFYFVAVEGYRT